MTQIIMEGKPVAQQLKEELKIKFSGREISLATLLIGDDAASKVYQKRLIKLAESLGIKALAVNLAGDISQQEAEAVLERLNHDKTVHGILPFMPLPRSLNGKTFCAKLAPQKDVDCLSPVNEGSFYSGNSCLAPCTPKACLAILKYYGIQLAGKHAVVLGRSNVVGKPVAMLLLQEDATVTICHSKTKNLPDILRQADIIIAAIGKAGFVTADMVKEGAVLVDVGINAVHDKIVGDISPGACTKASAYTPVPGGVGVVSNVMVMAALHI